MILTYSLGRNSAALGSEMALVKIQKGPATVIVDTDNGARLASLEVNGLNLLVGRDANPLSWGCFPMVPWVGRLRNSSFWYDAKVRRVRKNFGQHSIHGTVFDKPWQQVGSGRFSTVFDEDWPFAGSAHQTISLKADELVMTLEVRSEGDKFPASIGWHPWFNRQLERGRPAELSFTAGSQYLCDAELIPTGVLAPPLDGPWDDSFTEMHKEPVIHWPGAMRMELSSTVNDWTIYNLLDHAICVEPISGPPNSLNIAPVIVSPGQSLIAEMRLKWTLESALL
jgi:aldose 1-epimerase